VKQTKTNSIHFWTITAVIVFFVLVYLLAPVLFPFSLGAILAYILNPVVNGMGKRKIPRTLSVIIIFVIGLIILLLMIGVLVPILEKQIILLVDKIPRVVTWIQTQTHVQLDPGVLKQAILQHLQTSGGIAKSVWMAFKRSSHVLIEVAINLVLIPVVAIYLLRDWDKVTQGFVNLLPHSKRDKIVEMVTDCGEVLSAFFRGQLLVMIGLAIIYSTGLTIIGLDLSLLIGISAGLLSVIPYLGFLVGFAVSLTDVIVKYHDWLHVLYVCIVFAIGHVAESYVLQPWLIGNRIGLHPVVVIFAIVSGGILFGFTGVLIALPVAAVIMVLFRHWHQHYIHTDYYNHIEKDKAIEKGHIEKDKASCDN